MALFTQHRDGSLRSCSAIVTGDVRIGPDTSLWFNSVIRGDVAPVRIGARVNVQDGAIIHCESHVANTIEDDVSIGHAAIVHGALVGRGTLVGMGAKLLNGTRIGQECLIAAGAVVPPGMVVPDRHLVMGVPGRIARPLTDEDLRYLRWLTTHYVELAQRYVKGEFTEAPVP